MARPILRLCVLLAAGAFALAAHALEYRSLSEGAVMYDAPSKKAQPLFVIAAGTPVEAVVVLDVWVKVRDQKGDLAWVEKRLLSERRTLIVCVSRAQVRAAPDESSPLVFEAAQDVLLDLQEPPQAGWVKVGHRDGQTGYVRVQQVWGL